MSEDTLRTLAEQVRNWGRWGVEDEIGTLNYITREAIAGACRLVTSGTVFALGIPLQRQGPQSGTSWRQTVPPMGGTRSCWSRRLCRSPVQWVRRSIRTR